MEEREEREERGQVRGTARHLQHHTRAMGAHRHELSAALNSALRVGEGSEGARECVTATDKAELGGERRVEHKGAVQGHGRDLCRVLHAVHQELLPTRQRHHTQPALALLALLTLLTVASI